MLNLSVVAIRSEWNVAQMQNASYDLEYAHLIALAHFYDVHGIYDILKVFCIVYAIDVKAATLIQIAETIGILYAKFFLKVKEYIKD